MRTAFSASKGLIKHCRGALSSTPVWSFLLVKSWQAAQQRVLLRTWVILIRVDESMNL